MSTRSVREQLREEVVRLIDDWISDHAEVDRRDYCCYLPNTAELVEEIIKLLAAHKEDV